MTNEPDAVADPFYEHIGPPRDALVALVESARRMRESVGHLPRATSAAMAELAEEPRFAGEWGPDPVQQAYTAGALFLSAAEDHILAIVRLSERDPPPVFSHNVLARAALEACGRAQWMFETGIGTRRRIGRGMTERLFSLAQQDRLPPGVRNKEHTSERKRRIFDEADRHGLKKLSSKGEPPALEDHRPGATQVLRDVFKEAGGPELGQVLMADYSAVTHATLFGMTGRAARKPQESVLEVQQLAALHTSSAEVCSVLCALVIGFADATERKRKLFGWADPDWSSAVIRALSVPDDRCPTASSPGLLSRREALKGSVKTTVTVLFADGSVLTKSLCVTAKSAAPCRRPRCNKMRAHRPLRPR